MLSYCYAMLHAYAKGTNMSCVSPNDFVYESNIAKIITFMLKSQKKFPIASQSKQMAC